ncbi:M24 family metallopeptidase [Pigmentiphaga sp.]|uniref:M24 family metallopeptidase n=1 Tax=Pigmentiphaga sp. TaxID=1977564 RepID=UPI0025EE36F4|nr:M24 family metallopeptidase [Pigmentiphaga sp.]
MTQPDAATPPTLTLDERDRRWNGLRARMRERGIDAIVVGSFQGRERLESYLIDDFLDSVVVLTHDDDAIVMTFGPGRVSRAFESQRRGIPLWTTDFRIGMGGARTAEALLDKGLGKGRIGLVGLGPTAPGEAEGLMPLGFHTNLLRALPGAEFCDFTRDFTDFMLVKSDEELRLLRYAAQVSEKACIAMAQACRPGVSEAEVYAEILREIHRNGCDVRYPFLSLQSGVDNIGWGAPRWTLRAEPPRVLRTGDVVQAEIHTTYGGQEAQVQMCVALDPIDAELQRCESVARRAYEAGLRAVRPGVTFGEVVAAMEKPIAASGCWSKTPLLHTLTFGSTGFTPVNRAQLAGTFEERIEGWMTPGVRRADLVMEEGMSLELEPNACIGLRRVNIGAGVVVGRSGPEELNDVPTRVWHVAA